MRREIVIFALIGAMVANGGLTSASEEERAAASNVEPSEEEYIKYELPNHKGEVTVHAVDKQLVEAERQRNQEVEAIERKANQTVEQMELLLHRVLNIKYELANNYELDEAARSALVEELSVKTAALRGLFRKKGGPLDRGLEFLFIDFGLDFAVSLADFGKALASFFKEMSQ